MSSLAPKSTAAIDAGTPKRRPPRRTLQSGFSLLSRGEPKIWLTGGMLVICITMIVSLLTLILMHGLATFWPRQIDWLVLAGQQMDIGEPQGTEIRKPDTQTDTSISDTSISDPAVSATGGNAVISSSAGSDSAERGRPSRFYRTANFDVTGRHYRWFEPAELEAAGIVQPEWALVIERLSWGRMFGLPSHLAVPIQGQSNSDELVNLLATEALLKELPELLAPPAIDASAKTEPAITPSIEERLSAQLAQRIDEVRTRQLRSSIAQQLGENTDEAQTELAGQSAQRADSISGTILVQSTQSDEWTPLRDVDQLQGHQSLSAARLAWSEPAAIVDRVAPIVKRLAANRAVILRLMKRISNLDRRLSDARVAVRQAELDTRRTVMSDADQVGPLIERWVELDRIESRIEAAVRRAEQEFVDAELVGQWRAAASEYLIKTVAVQQIEVQQQVEAWRMQMAEHPPAVVAAVLNYEEMWRTVLQEKAPLEHEINQLRAAGEGYELTMSVPTDAQVLPLSAEDSQQLRDGKWTTAAQALLTAQGIQVIPDSTQVQHVASSVTVVTFDDPVRGRQWLWYDASHHDIPQADSTISGVEASADSEANEIIAPGPVWMLCPTKVVNCEEIVRIFPANRLSVFGKLGIYASRWREFLLDDPREANTEGGVFPAIWGTVVMTLIMTLAVVPFGVIAALYLREYTRSGPLVSLVRISINNLAGVPSIVYGVFGLAFFCYAIGAFIDGGPRNAEFGTLPTAWWYGMLGTTVVVGVAAFLMSLLSSGPDHSLSSVKRWLARIAPWLWLLSLVGAGILIFRSPFFHGFYEARLPTPTFGKEGLLWAALTLALLTLPVVIVATEEALAAVPNSLREGSLACGASKWQTIHRIVLPHARPGILTGAILAMARGIGEVAPLMLVGALPVAPDLPLDTEFPYFHGSRSFMHLGYQIYWLGFQSQNSEASKPLVFTCTLLLILIVIALNLSAILLRSRLRRRFQGNQF